MARIDLRPRSGMLAAVLVLSCNSGAVVEPARSDPKRNSARSDAGSSDDRNPATLENGCPTNTGFPGDEMCLAPPAAEAGFQLHYGPSEYGGRSDLSPFALTPGSETNDCFFEKTPNTSDVYVSGYQFQLRPGSHHMLVNVNPKPQEDGFSECLTNDTSPGLLWGTQMPKVDELSDPAPENEGLAVRVPAHSQAVMNFHVVNATPEPMLREGWLNYFYMDESRVTGIRGNVFLTGGLGFRIPPGTRQTFKYSCSPERPVRILSLASHMHAHGTRLSAWKVSAEGPSLVYEGFDWVEVAEMKYDSVHANPAPNRAARTPGGSSGSLIVNPDEALQWECVIDNTSNDVLTFRNEVYSGEMCVLVGIQVPVDDPMEPYDFLCSRQ